ncbi:MAG: tRNA (N(6)-L-threonylcarbamoyladenosine(37)-C(2))-methylthiotransferase MtaB [Bacilli bacterium]
MKSFLTVYLGCKVNHYECSAIRTLLLYKGLIEDFSNPDVVIINTCSVTSTADQKSRQIIRRYRKKFPHSILVVMGCYSQINHQFIIEELNADIVIGTSNRNKIHDYLLEFENNHQKIDATDDKPRLFCEYEELKESACSENVRAYLKIQDGCDNFCSYCLIPFTRGKSRSRSYFDIIKEAKFLIKQGYKEIVVTGIDVGSYGKDLKENISFSSLIEELLKLDGLNRLRISSIEASQIDEKLISLFSKYPNLAKHLHIPLQSGSNTVLERMNRKYVTEDFYQKIQLIHSSVDNIALTTDVIVGFPGETEEEFLETFNFIKKCNFSMVHVFPFSSRKGTKASLLKNQISPDIKNDRVHKLLDLSNYLYRQFVDKNINQKQLVLIEQYLKDEQKLIGHTSNYIEVKIPETKDLSGEFIEIVLNSKILS